MWPDHVSNPVPLALEYDALLTALLFIYMIRFGENTSKTQYFGSSGSTWDAKMI